jgi:hypothetical protein
MLLAGVPNWRQRLMLTDRCQDSLGLMARAAGALWITTILCGIFAEAYVRAQLIVADNRGATANNIMAAQNLFRLGVVADLVTAASMAGATVILYEIFRPTSRPLALGQLSFGLSGCMILAAGLATLMEPLILLGRLAPLGGMTEPSLNLLALGALKSYSVAYTVSLSFFAVQVGCIGLLILRSGVVPRLFGILFLIEAAVNTFYPYSILLEPAFAAKLYPLILLPGFPAEAGFAGWLLIVGIRRTPTAPTISVDNQATA